MAWCLNLEHVCMVWYLYKHRENLPYLTYKAGSNDVPRYAVFKINII